MRLKMYILVNQDIGMGKGKIASQVGHAVATHVYENHDNAATRLWMSRGQAKIILKAPQEMLEKFEKEGAIAIRDEGNTQVAPNSLTAVNLGIMKESIRDLLFPNIKELRLL